MKNSIVTVLILLYSTLAFGQAKSIQERLGYPKDAKLVIIHADDLGVSHSENAASIAAMEQGSVSSASIMVPCPWFPEIAAYAQSHPAADLGLHITLTSEWKYYKWGPVTAKEKVPGLVNKNGFLYSSVDSVYQNATASEVETETRNQVLRAKHFGIDPTHLDAHMGTALQKLDYFKAYLKVGHEFKIPVFIPRVLEVPLKVKFDTIISDRDVLVDHILSASPQDFKNGFANFYTNGLKNLKPGLTYLIIHTAYDDEEMRAVTIDHPDWGAAWRQEDFNFFSGAECKKLLKDNNIFVITWKEIRDKIVRK
ncbi:MAG TPA: polysaccharide deacetylase family protein [Chitinophagaceae bacterium]|nr:polysaccharide deacetylase family protein [Chitinophagaceae bacterium]